MKPLIFVDRRLPEDVKSYLEEHCSVLSWKPDEKRDETRLQAYLTDVEGYFTSGAMKVTEELLTSAPKLKVISTMSVGYNHFDIPAMRARGVIGTHTPYVLDDTVADLIVGLILSTARRITELDRFIRQGQWKGNEGRKLFGLDVHHRKLGIIGMGRIGEVVTKRAKFGFDMEVSYYNRSRKPALEQELGIEYKSMEQLLRDSDFIVLLTPLTPETKGLIGAEQFSMMKQSAIFINASRGATVDEQALIHALQSHTIAGAGLDVFMQEPLPAQHPLLDMDQVVMTPHIGSATEATRDQMAMLAARNLVHALLGTGEAHIVPELAQ
ncbi:2-hydroxyacid dehydrogenase [Paenibacillus sp. FSL W7-1287]|uniref:2-hydroxyacid dehydrogenase n=1 Tax=Paenibacillus sp. FSL W7-1287 TaxID=2954538 RepID=UPI0030F6877E